MPGGVIGNTKGFGPFVPGSSPGRVNTGKVQRTDTSAINRKVTGSNPVITQKCDVAQLAERLRAVFDNFSLFSNNVGKVQKAVTSD